MISGINKCKTFTKHISCECKCRFDGRNVIRINGRKTIYTHVSVKNITYVKNITFAILIHVAVKMENI